MTSNYSKSGVDLDAIFALYETGAKKTLTGITVAGVDLSDRFAPIEQGSAAAATGISVLGSDLNLFYAAIGTLSALNGASVTGMANLSATSATTTATATMTIRSNGTWQNTVAPGGSGAASGTWLDTTKGYVGNDFEIQFSSWVESAGSSAAVTGTPNVWQSLGSNVVVSITEADHDGAGGNVSFIATIRRKLNTANSITWDMIMAANGDCFAVGTVIRTPDGDQLVEDLMQGGFVSSFSEPTMLDEDDVNWRSWKISSLDDVNVDDLAIVASGRRFMSDTSIKINGIHSTPKHVYFVFDGAEYGWKQARSIVAGVDSLVDSDKNLVPVLSIEMIDVPTEFVALNVETLDTLMVKCGETYILAHNVSA